MSYRAAVLWELKGRSRKTMTCSVARLPSGRYRVIVSSGPDVMLSERFDDAIEAIHRSRDVAHQLIADGWTKVLLPRDADHA